MATAWPSLGACGYEQSWCGEALTLCDRVPSLMLALAAAHHRRRNLLSSNWDEQQLEAREAGTLTLWCNLAALPRLHPQAHPPQSRMMSPAGSCVLGQAYGMWLANLSAWQREALPLAPPLPVERGAAVGFPSGKSLPLAVSSPLSLWTTGKLCRLSETECPRLAASGKPDSAG